MFIRPSAINFGRPVEMDERLLQSSETDTIANVPQQEAKQRVDDGRMSRWKIQTR